MALSLTLFLTVSFHSSPYFTGADIVFLFAWTPMALAGAGRGVVSRRRGGGPGPPTGGPRGGDGPGSGAS